MYLGSTSSMFSSYVNIIAFWQGFIARLALVEFILQDG